MFIFFKVFINLICSVECTGSENTPNTQSAEEVWKSIMQQHRDIIERFHEKTISLKEKNQKLKTKNAVLGEENKGLKKINEELRGNEDLLESYTSFR